MKLRFDHQSIRLRVKKSDIEKLSREGFIEETVHFPQGKLFYRLEIGADSTEVTADIRHETIAVQIPQTQANTWMTSEEVGIYASVPSAKTEILLEILVEKDFPCKHGSTADNADSFEELGKS